MFGPPNEAGSRMTNDPHMTGVIPRAVEDIFQQAQDSNSIQLTVYCSFVQIYNENLYDMLRCVSRLSCL